MKSSREDVAKLAGVSVATVSYVLNKSRHVSDKTVNKVMNAIKDLDYHPDLNARSMVKGEYKCISVLVSDIVNPIQGEVIIGFENAAIEYGYVINICTLIKNVENYIYNFISRRNDGVYITAVPLKFAIENFYKLLNNGIKILTSGHHFLQNRDINSIDPDFNHGILEAIKYLQQLNHRKIAMISAFSRDFKYDNRIEIFCNSVLQVIPNASLTIIEGEPPYPSNISTGKELTRKLIETNNEFTAILCTNDLMAFGCISELRSAGLRVPEDVSVIGIDDIEFSSSLSPTLTTIGYNKKEFGKKAFLMLYDNIKNGNATSTVFKTDFIIRESSTFARE